MTQPMIKELDMNTLTDANLLRQVMDRVKKEGDHHVIKKNGEPEAALLPLEDLDLLRRVAVTKERAWDDFFENLKEVHALNAAFSHTEIEADVDAAIQEVRRAQ